MEAVIEVRRLSRQEAEAAFDGLARLRIEVFRDFPYLYEGDVDYERRYLATYMASPGAVIVGAFDGTELVGAATASPLADHFGEFAQPFAARGLDPPYVPGAGLGRGAQFLARPASLIVGRHVGRIALQQAAQFRQRLLPALRAQILHAQHETHARIAGRLLHHRLHCFEPGHFPQL